MPAPEPTPPPIPVQTEIGKIDGASFRIDIPKNWNHGLVLYFHGYQPTPQTFDPKYPPTRVLQEILNRGYAVARSGYAVGGWAVPQAATETEALRRYFRKKYGQPHETFLMGHSMGGLLTVMGLEQDPKDYAGGLALCGVLAPADLVMQRAFANRVAFDAFFPGVLPDVEHIPPSFMMNDIPTITNVQKSLDANPDQAALVRDLANIHTNRGLADVLVFNTFVIEDLRLKSGGNPFDNRNLVYSGTANDALLNQRVHRFAADPDAYRFLANWYSPSGNLRRKLLEVHTIYDPLVPARPPAGTTSSPAGSATATTSWSSMSTATGTATLPPTKPAWPSTSCSPGFMTTSDRRLACSPAARRRRRKTRPRLRIRASRSKLVQVEAELVPHTEHAGASA